MHAHDSDDPACPVCGQPYDRRIVIERGDRWPDLFGGTPLSFFRTYSRRCASRYDAERDRRRGDGEQVVYFHDDGPAGRR